ncbi:chloride channel protein [Streptomyces sp. Ag109_G2-15]|uniref:chloride channel protein n=1 Tax=Streptomyces sp. Ag109_G2-15 TaxID=1938850 RepID=UPI000BC91DEF|nr:chloride channel protein [Streptomyces sp. Ag109_G2-15]SOD84614.1 H+/Cl- antiporter ClcA [Streptomyces sp. Ag109_G2-15]
MTRSDPSAAPAAGTQPEEADRLRELLSAPAYRRTLLFSAIIGVPVSLAAFWFLAGLHALEHLLWAALPAGLGWDVPPWWWPLPLLALAGLVVGLVVRHLPGAGGHVPAGGLHAAGMAPAALPGVILAAAASLPLGATLGPEAPLIALGGGLALWFRDLARAPVTPRNTALLGAAGAAAALSAIFGNPLVGAVILIEVAGVGGPQLFAVMLPALLSSGIGSLVFTGFGHWTGLPTGSLSLKLGVPFPRLDAGDVLWSVVMAVGIAVALHVILSTGRLAAVFVVRRPVVHTVLCALAAGVCAAVYTLAVDRSPADVASSGEAVMAQLAADPHAWGVGALVAVLLCKGAAYALCLGSLRGGPVFPSLFLGAATGVLLAPLPGLGVVPGMAAGMAAAAAAALRLPVSSVVLIVLVLGSAAMIPVVILAAVVGFVTVELLPPGRAVPPVGKPAGPPAARPAATWDDSPERRTRP